MSIETDKGIYIINGNYYSDGLGGCGLGDLVEILTYDGRNVISISHAGEYVDEINVEKVFITQQMRQKNAACACRLPPDQVPYVNVGEVFLVFPTPITPGRYELEYKFVSARTAYVTSARRISI